MTNQPLTVRTVWQQVLAATIETYSPAASLEAALSLAVPVRRENGILLVQAPAGYAALLQDRTALVLARMLVGVTGQSCGVRFIEDPTALLSQPYNLNSSRPSPV